MMSWKENINTIKEIFPGQFQIILDFATSAIVPYILSNEYKYVWVYNHTLQNHFSWEKHSLPLFDSQTKFEVLARHIQFDFIMPTEEFRQVIPQLSSGITLIQFNNQPKDYLDLSRIKGKMRYELLKKECNYLFELQIPSATDYGTIVSSDRSYLQSLLDALELDWSNLP
jgi:hypothetical protein